jgi:hypothetical protein
MLNSRAKAYQRLFESDDGKFVLYDLYKLCRIDKISYVENSPDKTAFNEGAKYVMHYVKGLLKQSTVELDRFLEEQKPHHNNILKGIKNDRRK